MKITSYITLTVMTISPCYGMFGAAPQQQASLSYNQINLQPSGNVYIDASALGRVEGNASMVNFGFNGQPFSYVSAPMAYNSSMFQGVYFCLPSMQNEQAYQPMVPQMMQPMMQNIGPQAYQQMMQPMMQDMAQQMVQTTMQNIDPQTYQPMVQPITQQMMQTTMPNMALQMMQPMMQNMVQQTDPRNDQMTQPWRSPFEMHEKMRESSHKTAGKSVTASDNQVPPAIETIIETLNSMRSGRKLTQLKQKDRNTLLRYMCDSSANSKKVERMLQGIPVKTLQYHKTQHRKRYGTQVCKRSSIHPGLPKQVAELRKKTKNGYAIALAIRPGEEHCRTPFCQAVRRIVREIRLQNEGASAQPADFRKQRRKESTLAPETKEDISRLYQKGERSPIPIIEELKLCEEKDDWGSDIIAVAKYLTELGNGKASSKPKRAPRKRHERLNLTTEQKQKMQRLCAENYTIQEIAIRAGLIQIGEKIRDKSWYRTFYECCQSHKKATQEEKK